MCQEGRKTLTQSVNQSVFFRSVGTSLSLTTCPGGGGGAEKQAVTGHALVAGLEVRSEVVWTRLVAVQLGDRELADVSAGAQPVNVAQHVRRTPDESVVLLHAAPDAHPTVHR